MDIKIDSLKRKNIIENLQEYDKNTIYRNKVIQEFKDKYKNPPALLDLAKMLEKIDEMYDAKSNDLIEIANNSEAEINNIQNSIATYENEVRELIKEVEEAKDYDDNKLDSLDEISIKLTELNEQLKTMAQKTDDGRKTILEELNNLDKIKSKEDYLKTFLEEVKVNRKTVEEINAKLKELRSKFTDDILKVYETARNSLNMDLPLIIKVQKDKEGETNCICGITDNASETAKKIEENGVAQCPNCGRILYVD